MLVTLGVVLDEVVAVVWLEGHGVLLIAYVEEIVLALIVVEAI